MGPIGELNRQDAPSSARGKRIELNPAHERAGIARRLHRKEPAAPRAGAPVLSADSRDAAGVVERRHRHSERGPLAADDEIVRIENEALHDRRVAVAVVAGDIELDGAHERVVGADVDQIVRLVLKGDLLELPVAAIDARRDKQLALPQFAFAVPARGADPRPFRRTEERDADQVHARFVVFGLDQNHILLAGVNRPTLQRDAP